MTYVLSVMVSVGAAIAAAPAWMWLGLVAFACMGAVLGAWWHEHTRALHWETVAAAAQAEARGWKSLVRAGDRRTQVAPQYHAPIRRTLFRPLR
jgi:hypothetical protein